LFSTCFCFSLFSNFFLFSFNFGFVCCFDSFFFSLYFCFFCSNFSSNSGLFCIFFFNFFSSFFFCFVFNSLKFCSNSFFVILFGLLSRCNFEIFCLFFIISLCLSLFFFFLDNFIYYTIVTIRGVFAIGFGIENFSFIKHIIPIFLFRELFQLVFRFVQHLNIRLETNRLCLMSTMSKENQYR
jgi:hypothetical protein